MKKELMGGLLCLALTCCTGGTLTHQYQTVGHDGWEREDTLYYDIPEAWKSGAYALSVAMRYGNDFPYKGLWMEIDTRLNHPREHHRDTLYFRTADEQGIPLGKGVGLMQQETEVRTLALKEGQKGRIGIRHLMSQEDMKGVREMGIRLTIVDEAIATGIHTKEDKQQ